MTEFPEESGSTWYIAQLKPSGPAMAERNLHRQGFRTFLPRQEVTRRQGSRHRTRREPVFPGYLFVSFDPDSAPWRRINSTYGVARLLTRPDNRPAPVPEGFVEALMDRCDGDGQLRPEPDLAEGDTVRLLSGPFADTVARIETLDRMGRITILLDLMGQAVRTTVNSPSVRVERRASGRDG